MNKPMSPKKNKTIIIEYLLKPKTIPNGALINVSISNCSNLLDINAKIVITKPYMNRVIGLGLIVRPP